MEEKVRSVPDRLLRIYETRDPFAIARASGIHIRFVELKRQKGFCRYILRNFFIFINSNLSREMQRMTCAHELGHIFLHKNYLVDNQVLLEMETYDPKNKTEYEANRFAANLLIDEEDLNALLSSGADLSRTAASLGINENLLALKLEEMKKAGARIQLPDLPKRTFMKTIRDCAADTV